MANGYIPAEVERGCDPCRPTRVEQKAFLGGVLGIDVNGERQPISEAGIVDLTFIEEETREAAEQAIASAQAAAESEQTASEAAASARSSESAAQSAANAAEAAKADAEDAASSANASKNTADSYATAAQAAAAAAQVADGNAERSAESAIAAAVQAASSAGAAQQYANEAYISASTAQTASGAAQDAQTAAEASASTASSAATTATQAATDAQSAKNAAEAAQSNAASSATAASGSATAAAGSASQAAASATAAAGSATAAAASAATFETDPTLSVAGKAADAKKTGDALTELDNITKLNEFVAIPYVDGGVGNLDYLTGDVSTNAGINHTDYIDVSTYKTIKYNMLTTGQNVYTAKTGMAFYNSNKEYVSGFNALAGATNGWQEDIIDIPEGAVYARFPFWNGTASGTPQNEFYIYGLSKLYDTAKITKDYIICKNLFDKTAATQGKYVNINTGSLVDYSGMFVSDFIPVRRGITYSYFVADGFYGTIANRLALYDSEKNYICSPAGSLSNHIVTVKIPSGTYQYGEGGGIPAYCRFSAGLQDIDSAMFVVGDYPSKYYPYGSSYLPNSYGLNDKQISEVQSIAANGALYGKKIAYNGDSIAESRLQTTSANNGGGYAKLIADATGGTYANSAVSGGILASAVPSGTMPHSVVNTISNMPDDADLICLEGGINDYWRDVPLGDYSESDYSGTLDTTTLCGALESIFRQATQKWVGKPICFVIVHKIKSTVYVANSAGWTFVQGREKMIGICKKYAIPFYDAFAESGLNAYNDIQNTNFLTSNSSGTPDGCHPNESGYQKYYVPQLIALFGSIVPRT